MPKFGPNGVKALDSTTTVYRPARLKDNQGDVTFPCPGGDGRGTEKE